MIIKLFFHAFPLHFVRWTVIFYGNLPKTLFSAISTEKYPGSSSLPGFTKQGYKDSNLEMTESESVALPFGDSPVFLIVTGVCHLQE